MFDVYMRFHRILVFSFYDQKKASPGRQPFTFQQTASDTHPGFGGWAGSFWLPEESPHPSKLVPLGIFSHPC